MDVIAMKRRLIGKNVEPKCEYCLHGTPTLDGESVICPKKGILNNDAHCKRFRYDPLKRVPREDPEMLSFSESDFTLDLD